MHPTAKTPLRWPTSTITVVVYAGAEGRWSSEAILQQFRLGAEAWASRCSQARIVVRSEPGEGRVAEDGVNAVVFRDRTWCSEGVAKKHACYPLEMPAVTTVRSRPSGEIIDADVEIAAVGRSWAAEESFGRLTTRLPFLFAHELGHVLGLDDVCRPTWPAPSIGIPSCGGLPAHERLTLMNPMRPLTQAEPKATAGEAALLCSLYPRPQSSCAVVQPGRSEERYFAATGDDD